MASEKKMTAALMRMAQISSDAQCPFKEKLQQILSEVVGCIDAEKGSIMISEDPEYLDVVASTDPRLIGLRQRITVQSPATWVFLKSTPLYAENGVHNGVPGRNHFSTYKKDAFLVVPILSGDKSVGVLSVTEKQGVDVFSGEERETIITFAGLLIGAIDNYRLNETLKENQRILEDRNRKLEKLEKLRTDLFNMLIHDLKGPISEVVANIDILSYTVREENIEYVKSAQTGCDTLYRMISDLLDIARLEEGSLKLTEEAVSPEEILSNSISGIHSIARMRFVNLSEKRPEGVETIQFYGDRGMLVRVLQNLVINAIQYSEEKDTVEVGYDLPSAGRVRFYVRDEGPGVAPEFQDAIFDKFFQVNKKNDGRMYSTGLGLAFCKMAVTAHNGTIGVESDGKKGSLFSFTVPLNG